MKLLPSLLQTRTRTRHCNTAQHGGSKAICTTAGVENQACNTNHCGEFCLFLEFDCQPLNYIKFPYPTRCDFHFHFHDMMTRLQRGPLRLSMSTWLGGEWRFLLSLGVVFRDLGCCGKFLPSTRKSFGFRPFFYCQRIHP